MLLGKAIKLARQQFNTDMRRIAKTHGITLDAAKVEYTKWVQEKWVFGGKGNSRVQNG